MPAGSVLDLRTLHGIPVYNADDEAATGIPPAAADCRSPVNLRDAGVQAWVGRASESGFFLVSIATAATRASGLTGLAMCI